MTCAKCGTANAEGSWFCAKCGAKLVNEQGIAAPAVPPTTPPAPPAPAGQPRVAAEAATTGAATLDGFDEEAWRLAIGPRNTEYYLHRAREHEAHGTRFRWHWPAFFVTFYWLLYRKMWGWAVAYFVLPYVIAMVLVGLVAAAGGSGTATAFVVIALTLAYWIGPPMLANGLYHGHLAKIIERQGKSARNRERFLAQVEARGGTSWIVGIVVGVLMVIGVIGILAAVAIPAYQDYTQKAKVAEAIVGARQVATQVGESIQRTGQMPPDLETMIAEAPKSRHQAALRVDRGSAVIELDVALSPAQTSTIRLVPSREADGRITWSCVADAPRLVRLLPRDCRPAN